MKKRIFPLILVFSILTVFTGCTQLNSSENEKLPDIGTFIPNSKYCTFRLAVSSGSSARVVFPTPFAKESLYYKFSYLDSDANETKFPEDGSGVSYSTLIGKTFTLAVGEYLFGLDAYLDSACTKKVLATTKEVTLTADSPSSCELSLKSATDTTVKGSISVKMTFPASTGVSKVEVRLAKTSDAEGSVDSKELTISGTGTTKSVTYTNEEVEPGSYILYYTLSGPGIEPTIIPELVIVSAGAESSNTTSPIALTEDLVNTNIIYVSSTVNPMGGAGTKTNPFPSIEKAIALINSKGKTNTDWAICVSGTINCMNMPTVPEDLAAKSLTFMGTTSTGTDGLVGNGTYSALILENTIPVTILNLCVTNGGAGGIFVKGSGKVEIIGSAVTKCTQGGIRIASFSSSDVEIKQSMIGGDSTDKNTASEGGGINKDGTGTLTIIDSTIKGNSATNYGGGIYVASGTVILGEDAIIAGNSAEKGGGVFVNSGSLFMYGSAVIGDSSKTTAATASACSNTATTSGAGIYSNGLVYLGYSNASTKVELTGGVCYNYATDRGGIVVSNSKLFMDSGNISYNSEKGIYVSSTDYSIYGEFTMSGGAIKGNVGTTDTNNFGGGVYLGYHGRMTMSGGEISGNVLAGKGGGVCISNSKSSFTMSGGKISGNSAEKGGGVFMDTSDGTFTMKGSASIPAGSDNKNDVYLAENKTITLSGTLTASAPIAKITPESYADGTPVLSGSYVGAEYKNFALVQPELSQVVIDSAGKLKTVGWYKKVTGLPFLGTNIGDSDVFILGRTFTIPNLIVGITELTQEEYEMYGKYGKTDNNMPPNSNYDTGSANPVYPAYGISFYDMIIFCNLRSMADGLTPVYALGGETDPKKWNGISKDSATGKYCGPSEINSSWDAVSFDTSANGWRLPTEAEWEYLARGANLTNISFTYSGSNSASDVGWFSGENGNKPTAVKQKTANLLGLYDMSGNVFELCWDWEGTIDTSTPITGVASGTRRMVRGGGCTYGADPYGKVGDRHVSNTPVMRWANCGARLVRNAN